MSRSLKKLGYRRRHSKRHWFILLFLGLLLAILFLRKNVFFPFNNSEEEEITSPSSPVVGQESVETVVNAAPIATEETVQESTAEILEDTSAPLPEESALDVSFTSQAPYGNWDLPYQEACEETAALIVHYYYQQKDFDPAAADQEILALVDFQEQHYGFYKDTTALETARFIRDLWGYEVRVEEPTVAAIKKEIAAGRPVIIPAAGRELGNPFFSGEGPLYHMLVITGYTADGQFITNDPGTRRGEDYAYDENVLLAAIHDWNGGDVASGDKLMIVVEN